MKKKSVSNGKSFSAVEVLDYVYEYLKKQGGGHERKFSVRYITADDTDQGHSSRRAGMDYEKFLFVRSGQSGGWWLVARGQPSGLSYLQTSLGDIIAVKSVRYPLKTQELERVLDRKIGYRRGNNYSFSALITTHDGSLVQSCTSTFPTLASCAVFAPGCMADFEPEVLNIADGINFRSFLPPCVEGYSHELTQKIAEKVLRVIAE